MKRTVALAAGLLSGGLTFGIAAAEAPLDGKKLYDANCAKCHGVDGSADTPAGKAMKAHVLKDPKWVHVEPATVIHVVRENPKHKAVTEKVTDAELEAITAHIRELAGGSASPAPGATK
jgi:mono/diheme cytochrome c family protein